MTLWQKTKNTYTRYTSISPKAFDKICVWFGPIGFTFYFILFASGGFLPPISPSDSPEQVVSHYRRHKAGIKGGAALQQFIGGFYPFYIAAISRQMARIPGVTSGMTTAQAICGGITAFAMMIPSVFFSVTVYRLERSSEITQALNDISWLITVIPFVTIDGSNFAFSYAVMMDKRPRPLFPRYFALVNCLWPFGYWGALGAHCVYGGPFAWNGAIVFWFANAATGVGVPLTIYLLLKAIDTPDEDCEKLPDSPQPLATDRV